MNLYQNAGVDPDKAEHLLKSLRSRFRQTHNSSVISTRSGYASLFQSRDRLLSASCDGVGTKLLMAKELGYYKGLGQDLVAMSVNDLVCSGARPLFFMDYLAMGELDLEVAEQILSGLSDACELAQLPLIGGETAEMPGLYRKGDFDMVGMAVGELALDQLIDGENLKPGDSLVALESSGFHSNGFSLIRQLTSSVSREEKLELLTPTFLYHLCLEKIFEEQRALIKGMAHITGAGFHNIARIHRGFDYHLQYAPSPSSLVGRWLAKWDMPEAKAAEIFNMGLGLVMVTSSPQELISRFKNLGWQALSVGSMTRGEGVIKVEGNKENYVLKGKKGV